MLNISANSKSQEQTSPAFFLVFLSIEALIIMFGNFLLCCLFIRERKLRTQQNYFVISLSICDLFIGTVVPPCEYCAYTRLFGKESETCSYICGSMSGFIMISSVMNLSLIAADKYFSIKKPFFYKQYLTKSKTLVIIFCGWIITLGVTLVPFAWILNFIPTPESDINKTYTVVVFSVVIIIGGIIFYFYFKIVQMVRQKLKESQEKAKNPAGIKVCIIVAITFFVCWIPTFILELLLQNNAKVIPEASYASYSILLLNPCLDPLMYAYYRKDFRKVLRDWLKPKRKTKKYGEYPTIKKLSIYSKNQLTSSYETESNVNETSI
ncbi:D(2) dopamine receptor A [Hydra vulgaris]|uniref:D(2) dopamine receptor A n=1 Tax=Hydra vulgaris TaxID=6087 RepID=A0ABM4DGB2_HYDVU